MGFTREVGTMDEYEIGVLPGQLSVAMQARQDRALRVNPLTGKGNHYKSNEGFMGIKCSPH